MEKNHNASSQLLIPSSSLELFQSFRQPHLDDILPGNADSSRFNQNEVFMLF